jgi:hypothetical protein
MDWREVIHRYLSACATDAGKRAPCASRAQFIVEHGTTSLIKREQQNETQREKWLASQQVPSPESYKEIEASPTRVIAEVEKSHHCELSLITRFMVAKVDNEWKLDDIFWSCICEDGICFYCQGTGYCRHCNGIGFTRRFFGLLKQDCILCRAKPSCTFCNGLGRCQRCVESQSPDGPAGLAFGTTSEPS